MSEAIRSSTWQLPASHRHESAWSSREDAEADARRLIAAFGRQRAFYLTDKRGSWEVISYQKISMDL